MVTLNDILAQVTANATVEGSLITLFNNVSAQLATALANNDQATMQTIIDHLKNDGAAMAAAAVSGTPAATPAPTPPAAPAP